MNGKGGRKGMGMEKGEGEGRRGGRIRVGKRRGGVER